MLWGFWSYLSFGWLPQTALLWEKGCHPLLPGSRCPGSRSTSTDTQERVSSFLLPRGGSPGSPHDYCYCGGKEETSSLLARKGENPSFLLSLPHPPPPPQWWCWGPSLQVHEGGSLGSPLDLCWCGWQLSYNFFLVFGWRREVII